MAIDPDVPSQNNSLYSEFLHWLVVNIPDEDIERGRYLQEIFPFVCGWETKNTMEFLMVVACVLTAPSFPLIFSIFFCPFPFYPPLSPSPVFAFPSVKLRRKWDKREREREEESVENRVGRSIDNLSLLLLLLVRPLLNSCFLLPATRVARTLWLSLWLSFLHWFLLGDVLAEYLGPLPSHKGGQHRFIFLAHKQPSGSIINTAALPHAESCDWGSRARFSARKFAKIHRLGEPMAINYFTTQFDASVPLTIERCLLRRQSLIHIQQRLSIPSSNPVPSAISYQPAHSTP